MKNEIISGITAIDALQGTLFVWLNVGNTPPCLQDEGWLKITCHSSLGLNVKDLVHAMHLYSDCNAISIDEIKKSNIYICKEDPSLADSPTIAKITYQSIIQELHELSISDELRKLASTLNEKSAELIKPKNNKRAL
ncbi:hypothetical protein ACEUAI_12950 [Aeromonas veronii]|uniref:hypothetical protein n=1 Tax=Aeromonas hydrophila TaxID=644 RepID=UPI002B45A1E9|nr:hypothetical protein [Aeromonas hydrophila]